MSRLRPLGLGEIIDHGVALWRSEWRALFLLFLPFQLLDFIVVKLLTVLARAWLPLARGAGLELLRSDPSEGLAQGGAYLGLLVTSLLWTFFISQVVGVAATHFLMPRVTGRPGPSWGLSLRFGVRRLRPATSAFLLSLAWSLLVAAVVLLPGAALVFAGARWSSQPGAQLALVGLGALVLVAGAVGLVLWFIVRFVMMAQVLGAETTDGLGAFRRSAALASGRVGPGLAGWVKGRLTLLLTVVGAMLLLVSLVSSAPLVGLGAAYGAGFELGRSVDDVVPQLLLVPAQLLGLVMGSIFVPLYEAFKVTFYADMRVRREGLDLELELS